MTNNTLWQTKLHARLHDPAEKALVLLRDPAGHEGGTSKALHRDLGFDQLPVGDWLPPDHPDALGNVLFEKGIPVTIYRQVKRADWWASAADRPQWPMEEATFQTRDGRAVTRKVADWARVCWSNEPKLVHPLTDKTFDLKTLADTEIADVKNRSMQHFSRLIVREGDAVNWRKTLLAFWRFGPELSNEEDDDGKLGFLWPLLPADTRVPDHAIWDHLDLTSAFAGAFAGDPNGQAALLSVSIGPVQDFIAAARTTTDLWAGSHLLSRLSWEAMKVVCQCLGPDAILFPRLRGLPQVDVWLRDEVGLCSDWFRGCDWTEGNTDANPLFAAALPNRFVALVPESDAQDVARQVTESVRNWLQKQGRTAVQRLLKAAKLPDESSLHCYGQMRDQLADFPEVHWAAVPFSLVGVGNADRDTDLDTTELAKAMAPFFGSGQQDDDAPPGFLGSRAWRILGEEVALSGNTAFFAPNPGVLYPAVQELSERVLAAAKAVRPFGQTKQQGWRCSLTGETEWLTTDPQQLLKSYRRQKDTLWSLVAQERPAWAKKGEHLGALPALKRLWSTLFCEEVAKVVGSDQSSASRFVVSTHTMALAGNFEKLVEKLSGASEERLKIERLLKCHDRPPALPRRLAKHKESLAARVPAALDRLREEEGGERDLGYLEKSLTTLLGHKPDAYYALILLDGDHMGRILAGDAKECSITYRQSFHPKVRSGFDKLANEDHAIHAYGNQKRAISPNRHLAISAALNDFALHVVPEVVEREHRGRLIYAGGDDVLAMVPVADLLSIMPRLREAYSGGSDDAATVEQDDSNSEQDDYWQRVRHSGKLACKDGFARLPSRRGRPSRLMRMMGKGATASCGAVVAHHQTPLGFVLRELREAEKRAKTEGGRDAFSITVLKRSGGSLRFTDKWDRVEALVALQRYLADPDVSRRAAYNSLVWLRDLPEDADADMLSCLLAYQFERQSGSKTARDHHDVPGLARRLAQWAVQPRPHCPTRPAKWRQWLESVLGVAEFLAREVRSPATEQSTSSAVEGTS